MREVCEEDELIQYHSYLCRCLEVEDIVGFC